MYNSGSSFGSFLALAVVVGVIALAVYLIKRSGDELRRSEEVFAQVIQQLPSDKQTVFVMQYNSVKRNPTTAVLLALFLGGIGLHKFYMGQTGLGILYLVFCWTAIPGIIAFLEAFTIGGSVGKLNRQKALQTGMLLGASNLGNLMIS